MEETTSGKKRKVISHGDHLHHQEDKEDDENEEVKIEKFFALIKGIREARETLILNGRSDKVLKQKMDLNCKTKERKLDGESIHQQQQVSAWNPSFQPEDFMEEFSKLENPRATMVETSPTAADQDESKDGLDLKLSL